MWLFHKNHVSLQIEKRKSCISRHIANILKEGELQRETTVAKIATVVNRGIRGEVEDKIYFYNLDMIIAVGYRVSSVRATMFRQWATSVLKEFIKKGFVLDEERLKQGNALFGKDTKPAYSKSLYSPLNWKKSGLLCKDYWQPFDNLSAIRRRFSFFTPSMCHLCYLLYFFTNKLTHFPILPGSAEDTACDASTAK